VLLTLVVVAYSTSGSGAISTGTYLEATAFRSSPVFFGKNLLSTLQCDA
jgi:hypothetical protein